MMSKNKNFRSFIIWTTVALVVVISVLVVVKIISDRDSAAVGVGSTQVLSAEIAKVRETDWVLGSSNAKVVLIEYSDFECPACASMNIALENLAKNAGDQVAIVYRHFPLPSNRFSVLAARAAEAAGNQGKFWSMTSKIFAGQAQWRSSKEPSKFFENYAGELGLDRARFVADLNSKAVADRISKAEIEARGLNLRYTPTLFLNGRELIINDYAEIKEAVDLALIAE